MKSRLRVSHILQFASLWICIAGFYYFNPSGNVNLEYELKNMSKLLSQAKVETYDVKGLLKYHIEAEKAYMPTEKSLIQFEKPTISVFEDQKLLWHIDAEHGSMDAKASYVRFENKATAIETPNEKPIKTLAKSDYFDYLPKDKMIKTDALVHIDKPGIRIDTKGLQANLRTRKITLMQQSQVVFDNIKEKNS